MRPIPSSSTKPASRWCSPAATWTRRRWRGAWIPSSRRFQRGAAFHARRIRPQHRAHRRRHSACWRRRSTAAICSTSANLALYTAVHDAIHAHVLLHRDVDYVVKNGAIESVDEFKGRIAQDRRWPAGLHTAIEAKEGVPLEAPGPRAGLHHAAESGRAVPAGLRHDRDRRHAGRRIPPLSTAWTWK